MKQILLEHIQNPIIITALVILTLKVAYIIFKEEEKKFTEVLLFFIIVIELAKCAADIFTDLDIKYTGIILSCCPFIIIVIAVLAYIIIILLYKLIRYIIKTQL